MFRMPKSLLEALASMMFGADKSLPPMPTQKFTPSKRSRASGTGRKSLAFHIDGNTSPRKLRRYLARKEAEERA